MRAEAQNESGSAFTSSVCHINMEALYSIPFAVLELPNIKLKKPSWLKQPSAMVVFAFVLLSYFLVTGGTCISSASSSLSIE